MKPKILTTAICIAWGISMTTHAEISGYVKEQYFNGGLYTFISTFDDHHDVGWEYICSNSFEDMELAFSEITIEFDWASEDERDDYSYVDNCDVMMRTCPSGYYIYSLKDADGNTQYACNPCPASANGAKPESSSYWDYWDHLGDITDCYISSQNNFTDDTGTYKYNQNCYYKK